MSYFERLERKKELLTSKEYRERLMQQLDKAVEFFGKPPLLEEVNQEVTQKLKQRPSYLRTKYLKGETLLPDDYTSSHLKPVEYVTYNKKPHESQISLGVVTGADGVPKIESVEYSKRKQHHDTIYETNVTIFGLANRKEHFNPIQRVYLPDSDGRFPEAGIFVDFRQYTTGEEVKARISGILRSNGNSENSIVRCYPGDREIFPFLGNHIGADSSFVLSIDNSLLKSIEETLNPTFFSEDLLTSAQNVAAKRKQQ